MSHPPVPRRAAALCVAALVLLAAAPASALPPNAKQVDAAVVRLDDSDRAGLTAIEGRLELRRADLDARQRELAARKQVVAAAAARNDAAAAERRAWEAEVRAADELSDNDWMGRLQAREDVVLRRVAWRKAALEQARAGQSLASAEVSQASARVEQLEDERKVERLRLYGLAQPSPDADAALGLAVQSLGRSKNKTARVELVTKQRGQELGVLADRTSGLAMLVDLGDASARADRIEELSSLLAAARTRAQSAEDELRLVQARTAALEEVVIARPGLAPQQAAGTLPPLGVAVDASRAQSAPPTRTDDQIVGDRLTPELDVALGRLLAVEERLDEEDAATEQAALAATAASGSGRDFGDGPRSDTEDLRAEVEALKDAIRREAELRAVLAVAGSASKPGSDEVVSVLRGRLLDAELERDRQRAVLADREREREQLRQELAARQSDVARLDLELAASRKAQEGDRSTVDGRLTEMDKRLADLDARSNVVVPVEPVVTDDPAEQLAAAASEVAAAKQAAERATTSLELARERAAIQDSRVEQLTAENTSLAGKSEANAARIAELEGQIAERTAAVEETRALLADRDSRVAALTAELEQRSGEAATAQGVAIDLRAQLERTQASLAESRAQALVVAPVPVPVPVTDEDEEDEEDEEDATEEGAAGGEAVVAVVAAEPDEAERLRTELVEAQTELGDAREELAALEDARVERDRLRTEVATASSQLAAAEKELTVAREREAESRRLLELERTQAAADLVAARDEAAATAASEVSPDAAPAVPVKPEAVADTEPVAGPDAVVVAVVGDGAEGAEDAQAQLDAAIAERDEARAQLVAVTAELEAVTQVLEEGNAVALDEAPVEADAVADSAAALPDGADVVLLNEELAACQQESATVVASREQLREELWGARADLAGLQGELRGGSARSGAVVVSASSSRDSGTVARLSEELVATTEALEQLSATFEKEVDRGLRRDAQVSAVLERARRLADQVRRSEATKSADAAAGDKQ